jgi:molybdenum cofactor cytidylyltransferase
VNLYSEGKGIAQIAAGQIHALNRVHPMITVATVPPWQRLGPCGMIATIKIISYAVPESALQEACALGRNAIEMRSAVVRRAALIQSLPGQGNGDKGRDAIDERLTRLGVALTENTIVPHETGAMAKALAASDAEALFILTGSATSDLRDTAPEAVRQAGGEVAHYGMPVDPGNLLFFGQLRGKPVIGLPGCARSLALNGADWVMERILCGVPVTPDDIAAMGVGGLLKEIPVRGRLRDG